MVAQLALFEMAPFRDPGPCCVDCGVDTTAIDEFYMVHDAVWPIGDSDGMLCVGCLETRIGRRLTAADFTSAKCNGWIHSRRLEDRKAAEPEEMGAADLFKPDGRQRCKHCRRRLVPWAGRLYCTNAQCPGEAAP